MIYPKCCEIPLGQRHEKDRKGILAVDVDGVLTDPREGDWNDYSRVLPNKEMISKVNRLCRLGWIIVIHTSRAERERLVTETWLKTHDVHYWYLVMGKIRADFYLDDRSLKPSDIDELVEVSEKWQKKHISS